MTRSVHRLRCPRGHVPVLRDARCWCEACGRAYELGELVVAERLPLGEARR
jgi:hypothetical protein